MIRLPLRPAILLASAMLWLSPISAQTFQPKHILFKGVDQYPAADLLAVADLKPGASYTSDDLSTHMKALMDSGLFEDIAYTSNGQDLIFQLIPSALVYPIRFENLPLENDPALEARLHASLPLYQGKVPLTGTLLDGVRKELEAELAAGGIETSISAVPYAEPKTNKFSIMSFSITNPAVLVGEVRSLGVSTAMSAKEQTAIAGLIGSAYSSNGSLSALENTLTNIYHDAAYLQADIHATLQTPALVDAAAVHVPLAVKVDEGPRYTLAAVQLAPNLPVTQAEFDSQTHLHIGDIAHLDKLRASLLYLNAEYRNKGFMRARVAATPTYDPAAGTVSYLISAQPGPVYTMGALKMENLNQEQKAIIMTAWTLSDGATFHEDAVQDLATRHGAEPEFVRLLAGLAMHYLLTLHDDTKTVDVDLIFESKHG